MQTIDIWTSSLVDADKAMLLLCEACVTAGPWGCALYEVTAEQVLARINGLLEKIKTNPIAVSSIPGSSRYGIVDYKTIKIALWATLFHPYYGMAPAVFESLAAAEKGNIRHLVNLISMLPPFRCFCPPTPPTPSDSTAARIAVLCEDAEAVGDSMEELQVRT